LSFHIYCYYHLFHSLGTLALAQSFRAILWLLGFNRFLCRLLWLRLGVFFSFLYIRLSLTILFGSLLFPGSLLRSRERNDQIIAVANNAADYANESDDGSKTKDDAECNRGGDVNKSSIPHDKIVASPDEMSCCADDGHLPAEGILRAFKWLDVLPFAERPFKNDIPFWNTIENMNSAIVNIANERITIKRELDVNGRIFLAVDDSNLRLLDCGQSQTA